MRLGLISTATFPVGDVTTIRYSTYCNALADAGHFVKVYVLTPNTLGINHSGKIKNVHYSYLQRQRNNNRFVRYAMGVIAMFRSLYHIKKDHLDVVLIYLTRRTDFIFYKLFSSLLDVKLVTDQTEYFVKNYINLSESERHKVDGVFDGYDGVITISKELYDYHTSIAKGRKVFLLPMTIDPHRFAGVHESSDKGYITVVFGVHNRDGLDISIKSYCKYHKLCGKRNIKPWKLRLIGNIDRLPVRDDILELIKESGVSEDILILGKQPIEVVPSLLYNSSCLLTTASTYISGGFPTKLGEYLLSGVPVVATKAGEISNFLEDGINSYLCEVDNWEDISEKLFYIHNHSFEAAKIGKSGYQLAITKFNILTYLKDLTFFLSQS